MEYLKTVQFLQLHNFLRTPYVIFYTYQWSTSWGKIYTPFSLYYDGVLHEAKFIIGHGVLKIWYHGRIPLFTFWCIAMEYQRINAKHSRYANSPLACLTDTLNAHYAKPRPIWTPTFTHIYSYNMNYSNVYVSLCPAECTLHCLSCGK